MARVLVLGSSNTDMTVRLPLLPTPGQTILGGSFQTGPGGKGANQAVGAARAGGEVVFVTAVGADTFGRASLDAYRREGLDVSHALEHKGASSGIALIFVGDDGENMIGVAPGANSAISPDDIDRLPEDLFEPGRLLLVAGLEVPLAAVHRAIARASLARMRVILNPAPFHRDLMDSDILESVDVVTPNRIELWHWTGIETETVEGVLKSAEVLQARRPLMSVLVTLGAGGCLVVHEGKEVIIPAHAVQAVDTVGAGDAFNGSLAVALAEGRPLLDAAAWATAAGALAVTKAGAQSALPYRSEIDRLAAAEVLPD